MIAADRWLNRRSRLLKRCDEASTQAAIVSKTIDINPVVRRIRVDLETDLAPAINADAGGKSLDIGGGWSAEVPLTLRGALFVGFPERWDLTLHYLCVLRESNPIWAERTIE